MSVAYLNRVRKLLKSLLGRNGNLDTMDWVQVHDLISETDDLLSGLPEPKVEVQECR